MAMALLLKQHKDWAYTLRTPDTVNADDCRDCAHCQPHPSSRHSSPLVYRWFACGLRVVLFYMCHRLSAAGAPLVYLRFTARACAIQLRVTAGVPLVHLWLTSGSPLDHLWFTSDSPLAHVRFTCGLPLFEFCVASLAPLAYLRFTCFTWITYVHLWFIAGLPLVHL